MGISAAFQAVVGTEAVAVAEALAESVVSPHQIHLEPLTARTSCVAEVPAALESTTASRRDSHSTTEAAVAALPIPTTKPAALRHLVV